MKFTKIISALLLMASLMFVGQSSAETAKGQLVNSKPALWVVEQGGYKTYFFGSFHMLPQNVTWYGGEVRKAFESADNAIFEVDVSDPKMEQKAGEIMKFHMMMPIGDSVKNHLGVGVYKKMLIKGQSILGMHEKQINRFQPWFLSLNYAMVSTIKIGFDPNAGVDKSLEMIAAMRKMKVSGLETIESQIGALVSHPMPVQVQMLKDTLEELDDLPKIIKEMLVAWRMGDEKLLNEVFIEKMKTTKELYDALLVQRNKNWVPVIIKLIEQKENNFITVGTAHLIGDDSVINMLKAKGYTIKRVQ